MTIRRYPIALLVVPALLMGLQPLLAQSSPCESGPSETVTQTDPSHEPIARRPVRNDMPCGDSVASFGTTVVSPSGFHGQIYKIKKNTEQLPNFKKLTSVGSIYTSSFAVAPRDFSEGFPGVPDLLEWFAIDYTGKFWIEHPGTYRFVLTSDDGAKLYIDDHLIVDNDGAHVPQAVAGQRRLDGGIHTLRLSYFQGPRFHVALMLEVAAEGESLRIFSTEEFKPPSNPEDWKFRERENPPVH